MATEPKKPDDLILDTLDEPERPPVDAEGGEARKSPLGEGDASAPGHFRTAQRPGQSGDETEHRPGPNPRSPHQTGPHPPFEPEDPGGLAAEKHRRGAGDAPQEGELANRPSGTIRSVDLKGRSA